MTDPLLTSAMIVSPAPAVPATARVRVPARIVGPARRAIRARYDAAQTTDENRRHWAKADGLSARAANSAEVRYRLRNRARYETANNSYAKGIVLTLANDTIGTGPRLQMLTDDPDTNALIEKDFKAWCEAIGLAAKLRTMRQSRAVDGEAFGVLTTNPRLTTEVKLDLKLIEADQVATPDLDPIDPNAVDGIRFDGDGNPVEYHVLREHPGDVIALGDSYDRISARYVLHWFRADRPGQCRGVPDIMPALELFGKLRRYTLAVLGAAEIAADFAAVLESEAPANATEDPAEAEPFDTYEVEYRMMMTLPAGQKMNQFKAEQPTTTYKEFKAEILNEIARCLNMPFNIAAGNSAGYNYSSGRLDHQTYYRSIYVEQDDAESVVMDRIFPAWLDEYALATDLLPDGPGRLAGWPHLWFWDGFSHVDPQKEATAQETCLRNNTTTLADEWGRRGFDWETKLRQRAKELRLMAELGVPSAPAVPPPAMQPVPIGDNGDGIPEDD